MLSCLVTGPLLALAPPAPGRGDIPEQSRPCSSLHQLRKCSSVGPVQFIAQVNTQMSSSHCLFPGCSLVLEGCVLTCGNPLPALSFPRVDLDIFDSLQKPVSQVRVFFFYQQRVRGICSMETS